jgi:hypothetical protein
MGAVLENVAAVFNKKAVEICEELQKVEALFIMVGITNPMASA